MVTFNPNIAALRALVNDPASLWIGNRVGHTVRYQRVIWFFSFPKLINGMKERTHGTIRVYVPGIR